MDSNKFQFWQIPFSPVFYWKSKSQAGGIYEDTSVVRHLG